MWSAWFKYCKSQKKRMTVESFRNAGNIHWTASQNIKWSTQEFAHLTKRETAVLYFTCHLPCYTSIWNWYMWTGSRLDMLLMMTYVNAPLSHLNADNACKHFAYIILYDPLHQIDYIPASTITLGNRSSNYNLIYCVWHGQCVTKVWTARRWPRMADLWRILI